MSDAKQLFAIVRYSGRVEMAKDNLDYFGILAQVYREIQGSGSNADLPNKLMLNGSIVVDGNLDTVAWRYGNDHYAAEEAARAATREKHRPAWLAPTTEREGR
jgi:hypothetical protein